MIFVYLARGGGLLASTLARDVRPGADNVEFIGN
jgi:hypothetical protein